MNRDEQLAECQALVDEVLLAWRLLCPDGARLDGECLMRWRLLPEAERRYFAALVAPYEDPHSFERTQTVEELADGSIRYHYDPPYPEPCECGRPVHINFECDAARCPRCLRAWPLKRQLAQGRAYKRLPHPIVGAVAGADIGYALERALA